MLPVLIIMAMGIAGLTVNCVKHGKDKKVKYNGWDKLLALLIAWSLYYWAGLFDELIKHL